LLQDNNRNWMRNGGMREAPPNGNGRRPIGRRNERLKAMATVEKYQQCCVYHMYLCVCFVLIVVLYILNIGDLRMTCGGVGASAASLRWQYHLIGIDDDDVDDDMPFDQVFICASEQHADCDFDDDDDDDANDDANDVEERRRSTFETKQPSILQSSSSQNATTITSSNLHLSTIFGVLLIVIGFLLIKKQKT
jgi:hypothetical protein